MIDNSLDQILLNPYPEYQTIIKNENVVLYE